ncbi:hypothetical protein [Paracoccus sp. JM45]|uniref:hypothetical protein n=1 Tax=Paracoccus sp. JM45 TaxID=2283626 RepID=UPI000E6D4CDA|nr:hypothetical protein [Paracoccus sp. JM45]RJE80426.1 hypothetical protein DWB67_05990 [Paracoccus sp. JM45]
MSVIARISSLAMRDRITTVGFALTGGWLLLVALFWILTPPQEDASGGIARLVATAGIVLPVALVWLGVSLGRQLAILRAEAQELRDRLNRLQPDYQPADDYPLEAAEPARPASVPAPVQPRPVINERPARPEAPTGDPVDSVTLIRALNFPDGPDDQEAIDALRLSLKDPANSRVLRSAQDVVTLMAGRDVYMDNMPPEAARPDVWRRFADGERGSAVAALGGIHDPEAMEIVTGMMDQDEVFRDTAQHFLRNFDSLIERVVPELDDIQISVLADTRSARAFMLLGRVSGIFG